MLIKTDGKAERINNFPVQGVVYFEDYRKKIQSNDLLDKHGDVAKIQRILHSDKYDNRIIPTYVNHREVINTRSCLLAVVDVFLEHFLPYFVLTRQILVKRQRLFLTFLLDIRSLRHRPSSTNL